MSPERCPTCAGPVEPGGPIPTNYTALRNGVVYQPRYRVLPDTLEGIEANAVAIARRHRGDLAATLDEQHGEQLMALRRLFNGCATCGRKPVWMEPWAVNAIRGQAFQYVRCLRTATRRRSGAHGHVCRRPAQSRGGRVSPESYVHLAAAFGATILGILLYSAGRALAKRGKK